MKKISLDSIVLPLIMAFTLLLTSVNILATNYYVDPSGSDSNTGTSIGAPYQTITKAVSAVNAGDTIFVRGGTHPYTSRINITRSGSNGNLICMFVYPGDARPVLDFSGMAIGGSNRGIYLTASYWHIKGLRIKGVGDNGMLISGGNYNIIEFCDFFENRDGGCQLGGGAHDNRIINCDSYYNADYVLGNSNYTGGNADGFSPKLDVGTGNYF